MDLEISRKKCVFLLRFPSKIVDFIPKIVVPLPKKVDLSPKTVDLSISQQDYPIPFKTFKLLKLFPLKICKSANFIVPLYP